MADRWTDFGSGFEDTGDGQQLEDSLFATGGGVFDEEVKADAFEAVAAAQPPRPRPMRSGASNGARSPHWKEFMLY